MYVWLLFLFMINLSLYVFAIKPIVNCKQVQSIIPDMKIKMN